MKIGVIFIVILVFTTWGCSDTSTITEVKDMPNSSVTQNVTTEPNWIQLPEPKYPTLSKTFEKTKLIKADSDCFIQIYEEYEDVNGNQIIVAARIVFSAGTLDEDTEITMKLNDRSGVLTFTPHMNFNNNAILSMFAKNPKLVGIDEDDISFHYLSSDGTYESVDVNKLKINGEKGQLRLLEAELPHFSRYGFTR